MTREVFSPRSRRFDEREIHRIQQSFEAGMFSEQSTANKIPQNGVAYLSDFINKGNELSGRGGSKLWSTTALPNLRDSGYTTGTDTVSSNVRTIAISWTTGRAITSADLGNWIVWPDGDHEKILSFSSTGATSATITTYARNTAVKGAMSATVGIRGKVNLFYRHKKQNKIVLHIDTRLYVASTTAISSWTLAIRTGEDALADSSSQEDATEYRDYLFFNNNGFIYKVDLSGSTYTYRAINTPVPTVLITSSPTSVDKVAYPYIRRYTYSASILSGTGHRDRTTSDISIYHETGTTDLDSSSKDYGDINTSRPIGDSATTYDSITTMPVTISGGVDYRSPSNWSVSDARFRTTVNGTTSDISTNLAGSTDLGEIASRIEAAMQAAFTGSNVECNYKSTGAFEFISPNEGGTITSPTTISVLPSSAVHIADNSADKYLTSGGDIPATATSNKYTLSVQDGSDSSHGYNTVGRLTIPVDSSSNRQYGYTHYSVYCSLDIGTNGIDPITGNGNQRELLIWNKDIPVCNVMKVNITSLSVLYSLVTCTQGTFYQEDVGCHLKVSGGVGGHIACLCDASGNQVYTDTSLYAKMFDTTSLGPSQVAAVGDESTSTMRIFAGTQSGYTVTVTTGFVNANDVGKMIHWYDFTYSVISAVDTGTQTYTVTDSATRSSYAFCIDPVSRYYNDIIRDETLRTRISAKPCRWRAHIALPAVDFCIISNGFLFAADENGTVVYTSPMPEYYEENVGYYYPGVHQATVQDKIKALVQTTDSLIVFCEGSIKQIDINSFDSQKIEEIGISLTTITGTTDIDKNIGVSDRSAILNTELGSILFISTEPAIRTIQGNKVDKTNLAEMRIMDALRTYDAKYILHYDRCNGFLMWFRDVRNDYYPMTKCWAYGINREQGIGFSERTGTKWIWPETRPITILDSNGYQRILSLDGDTGKVYEMYSRTAASTSELKFFRKDKEGINVTVSGVTLSGTNPVSITATSHGFVTGNTVEFYGVGGTTQLNNTVFTITRTNDNAFTLDSTSSANYSAWTSGGYCFKAGTDIAPKVRFAEDTGTIERHWIDHISHSIFTRPFPDRASVNGYDTNGYPNSIAMTDTIYADGNLTTSIESLSSISLPKHEILFDRRVQRAHRLQNEISFNKSEIILVGRIHYYKASDTPDTPVNRRTNERTYQLTLWAPTLWLARGSSLLTDRVSHVLLSGTATAITGPDGITNSAMRITSQVSLANSAQASGMFLIWHKSGYTISGVALTEVSNNGTWYLSYSSAPPANIILPTGDVYSVRIYSSAVDSTTRTYYYNDVISNYGKSTEPRW